MKLLRVAFLWIALTAQIALAQGVVVRVPPPPPPPNRGVVGRAPHPGFVWTPGYQRWNGRRYVWDPGRWVQPPRRGAVWVQPRWIQRGNQWVFHPGRWR